MASSSRTQSSIQETYPHPNVQSRPPYQYPSQILQVHFEFIYSFSVIINHNTSLQHYHLNRKTLLLITFTITLSIRLDLHYSSSLPYQIIKSPILTCNIFSSISQQYRTTLQQQVLPTNIQQPYPSLYQPQNQQPYQQPQPQYSQSQPQYQQQLVQQPNENIYKDDDLEKKFQHAVDRTRDLMQRNLNLEQPKQQQKQEYQMPNFNENEQEQKHNFNLNEQYQIHNFNEQEQKLQDLALQYADGDKYRGQGYKPATREGYGYLTDYNDNLIYQGYWHDNKYHGHGNLTNFQTEQIDGPFDYQDLREINYGWLRYVGDFFEGKSHGERFEGNFNDDMIDGEGIYSTMNRQTINGVWKEGILINYI